MLPKDTSDIRSLVEAFTGYIEADNEERFARNRFVTGGGHSWGYAGYSVIKAREEAAIKLGERLDEYIDSRIRQQNARTETP